MSTNHTTVPLEGNRQVVMRSDWLPRDSPFQQLTDLAEEHREALDDLRKANTEIRTLTAKFEAEDARALEAMRQSYMDGADNAKPPKRTPQMERDARLQALRDKSHIIQESLEVLIEEIVQTIQEHEEEWCGVLREGELAAQEKVQELRAQLALAEQEALKAPDLRDWLQRAAKNRTGWHIHWAWYLDKQSTTPTDMLTIANSGKNVYNSSPSPNMQRETEATAEALRSGGGVDRATSQVPDYSDETLDYGSPDYLDRLDSELRAHVVKQRAGRAAPGGM